MTQPPNPSQPPEPYKAPEPYDDSFSLGPMPRGDVLFEPPRHVGSDSTKAEPAPNPYAPPTHTIPSGHTPGGRPDIQPSRPLPPEYLQDRYHPVRPSQPHSRPTSWGPSQVNIPPVSGPDPRTTTTPSWQQSLGRNTRLTRWTPSRGSKKGSPLFAGLIALVLLANVFGGVVGWLKGLVEVNDSHTASSQPSFTPQPGSSGQLVEGMRLEPSPSISGTESIFWRINASEDEFRTYQVWHNGEVIRTFSKAGRVVTSEYYQPGQWAIFYTGATPGDCTVFIESAKVATLEDPASPNAACLLDTAWFPELP